MHGGFLRLSTCRPVPAIRHPVSIMYACRLHAQCTSASPSPLGIFGQTDNTRQSGAKIDCPLAYPGLVKRQAWLLDSHGSASSPRMFHYLVVGRGKLEVLCRKMVSHVPDIPVLHAARCGRPSGTYLARRGNQPPFARLVSPCPALLNRETKTTCEQLVSEAAVLRLFSAEATSMLQRMDMSPPCQPRFLPRNAQGQGRAFHPSSISTSNPTSTSEDGLG